MQIIRDRRIVNDHWQHVPDSDGMPEGLVPPRGDIIVSIQRWQLQRDALLARGSELGLRLCGTDDVEAVAADLHRFRVIALEFAAFTDGQGYSQARLLRERYNYAGEIRAVGEFISDQMFFLERSGVNAFEIPPGEDLGRALRAFSEMSVTYQPAADRHDSVFHRRRQYVS